MTCDLQRTASHLGFSPADVVAASSALGPSTDSDAAPAPPQTPILTEITHNPQQQQQQQKLLLQQKQQQQHTAAVVPVKALSIREATARTIEKHLEKVRRRECRAAALHDALQVFPTRLKKGVEGPDVAASLRIRGDEQRWAQAQKLVMRMRKFTFAVAWDVFGLEVKEGRCVLHKLNALLHSSGRARAHHKELTNC